MRWNAEHASRAVACAAACGERPGSGDGERKTLNPKQMNSEPLPASDLFSEDLRSYPPRIVELRRFYDEAKAAYDAADAHEDESGEEIPREIRMDYHYWERQLRIEEARVASENKD